MKLLIIFIFFCSFSLTQVSITTSNYSQNFGTTAITTWTNNSTFPGWYINDASEFKGELNITSTAPTNTGGVYVYRCSGGNDRKLGSRASGGTGIIHYGLRIQNNTGSTINSITVSYTGFQLSRAENNNNSNVNTFSYKIVSSPSVIDNLTTTTGYTSVAGLNYTAPINHGGPGTSNQVNGIPCTSSSNISSCIPVTILNNGEIMLRWTDINNSANDHHLAIDDVQVLFHFDNACAVTLPVELIDFTGSKINDINRLDWSVASERDNDYYTIEKSIDGLKWQEISKINGYGTTTEQQNYYIYDNFVQPIINYYKLSQTDLNGLKTDLKTIAIDNRETNKTILKITDILGRNINIDKQELKIIYYENGTIEKKY